MSKEIKCLTFDKNTQYNLPQWVKDKKITDIDKEIIIRNAIKYCIENFDSKTATNRIVEFFKDEL